MYQQVASVCPAVATMVEEKTALTDDITTAASDVTGDVVAVADDRSHNTTLPAHHSTVAHDSSTTGQTHKQVCTRTLITASDCDFSYFKCCLVKSAAQISTKLSGAQLGGD